MWYRASQKYMADTSTQASLTVSDTIRHNRSRPTTARSMRRTLNDCAELSNDETYSKMIGLERQHECSTILNGSTHHVSAMCCLPLLARLTIISRWKTQAGSYGNWPSNRSTAGTPSREFLLTCSLSVVRASAKTLIAFKAGISASISRDLAMLA